MPDWLARRVTVERMQRICEKTQLDDGRALVDNLLDNIPAALIVLLPLMAFVLKVLYPLSKRYYVEHLSVLRALSRVLLPDTVVTDPVRATVRIAAAPGSIGDI